MTRESYTQACMDAVYLASCVVNGRKPDPQRVSGMDLEDLFTAAQKHMLTAVTAAGLESAGVKNDAFVQAKAKAIRRSVLTEADRAQVEARLEENGIWYMPLKGAVLKNDYPALGLRQMSDIDILIDADRADDVRQIMESLGFRTTHVDAGAQDVYVKPPVSHFEMHRALFGPAHRKKLRDYYAGVKDRLVREEGKDFSYRFTPEDFYIYLIVHEYKHYAAGGTGLRSLLDTYVYLKKHGDGLDRDCLGKELGKLGLTDFEAESRQLAFHLFDGEELTAAERDMLAYIVDSGTYGTMENIVKHQVARRGRLGYLFRRVFLPYREMCPLYPVLKKAPILLPFCWIVRWVRAVATKRSLVAFQLKTAFRK